VDVLRYVIAYDVGVSVNPMLVEGQLLGGFAQGLGGTLLEEFAYGEMAQPQSVTFQDYLLPTSVNVPAVELIVTEDEPSPVNPLGVKGAGEGGAVGPPAALANAVADALGVEVTELPLSPDRVWRLATTSERSP
jgi:carbon-monoxide dehydrogenase large subunit/6-hydroxypseudooxynicotine dehydrogenase subunit gamma